jgi:hypothetical protein
MVAGTPSTTLALTASPTLSGSECSPITEIFTNGSQDLLFMGVGLSSSPTYGALASVNVTTSTPAIASGSPVAQVPANGGTSGVIVDNISTQTQASSIYFTSQSSSTSSVSITSVARSSGGVVTITANNSLVVGQLVVIAGVTTDGGSFNGTFPVVTRSSSQFTYNQSGNTVSATAVSGPTASNTASNCGASKFCAVKLTQSGLQ